MHSLGKQLLDISCLGLLPGCQQGSAPLAASSVLHRLAGRFVQSLHGHLQYAGCDRIQSQDSASSQSQHRFLAVSVDRAGDERKKVRSGTGAQQASTQSKLLAHPPMPQAAPIPTATACPDPASIIAHIQTHGQHYSYAHAARAMEVLAQQLDERSHADMDTTSISDAAQLLMQVASHTMVAEKRLEMHVLLLDALGKLFQAGLQGVDAVPIVLQLRKPHFFYSLHLQDPQTLLGFLQAMTKLPRISVLAGGAVQQQAVRDVISKHMHALWSLVGQLNMQQVADTAGVLAALNHHHASLLHALIRRATARSVEADLGDVRKLLRAAAHFYSPAQPHQQLSSTGSIPSASHVTSPAQPAAQGSKDRFKSSGAGSRHGSYAATSPHAQEPWDVSRPQQQVPQGQEQGRRMVGSTDGSSVNGSGIGNVDTAGTARKARVSKVDEGMLTDFCAACIDVVLQQIRTVQVQQQQQHQKQTVLSACEGSSSASLRGISGRPGASGVGPQEGRVLAAGDVGVSALVSVLVSLARLGHADSRLADKITPLLLQAASRLDGHSLASVAWSYAMMQYKEPGLMQAVAEQALAQWDTLKSMDALRLCWALAHIGMLTPPAADTPPTGHAPAQSKALQALAVHAAALLDRLDVQEAYVSSPPSTPPSLMSSPSEAAGLAMDVGHTSAGASSGRGPQQQQQHQKQQRLGRHAAANEQALLLELKLLLTGPHHAAAMAAASVPGASIAC